jgi:predicted HicB family RNase H-like nuclease
MTKTRQEYREGMKQLYLAFDMPADWHSTIKIRAIEQNKSMKDWVLEAIHEKLKREEELGWK